MLLASVVMGASGCKMFCHIHIHLTSLLAGLYSWGMLGDNSNPATSPTSSTQKSAADSCDDQLINLKIRSAVFLPNKQNTTTSLQQRKISLWAFHKRPLKIYILNFNFPINVLGSYTNTSIHRYKKKNERKCITHKSVLQNGFKSAKNEICVLKTECN